MELDFTKMHGLGNDFVVINALAKPVSLSQSQLRAIADRRTGVGCDQLLLVEPPTRPDADFDYRIFNADGGEVEHCGNGARCFALYVRSHGLTDKTRIPVNTEAGLIELIIEDDGQVTVNMGIPTFLPSEIPFVADEELTRYSVAIDSEEVQVGVTAIGNPHAVLDVENVAAANVDRIGSALQTHPRFPSRVNVGFRHIVDRHRIQLRVFERGVGETRACGTGACAAAIVGQKQGVLDSEVRVSLPGGDLMVNWAGDGRPVMMTGPARTVYRGTIIVSD